MRARGAIDITRVEKVGSSNTAATMALTASFCGIGKSFPMYIDVYHRIYHSEMDMQQLNTSGRLPLHAFYRLIFALTSLAYTFALFIFII